MDEFYRLYESQDILTSKDIPERWLKVIRECKRKGISMKPEYSLLEETHEESAQMQSTNQSVQSQKVKSSTCQSSGILPENSGITSEETTQRKGNKRKRN